MANTTSESTIKGTLHNIGDAATRISDKVSEFGESAATAAQNAVKAVDAQRAPIAKGIDSAASVLHAGGDSLENTATYIRQNKVSKMLGDVKSVLKANPTATLIGAMVVAFAVGRMTTTRRG